MADSDRTIITHLDEGRFGSVPLAGGVAAQNSAVQQLHQRWQSLTVTAAESSATTDITQGFLYTDRALLVLAVAIIPGAAVTASDTAYKTVSLQYNNGKGGSSTTIFQVTTQTSGQAAGTGSWVAGTVLGFAYGPLAGTGQWSATTAGTGNPFTAANVTIPANSLLQIAAVHTGAGVVVGPASFAVLLQEV